MDLRDYMEGIEDIKDLVVRPGYTIRKKTAASYGMTILAAGAFCADVYIQPTFVAPCDAKIYMADIIVTTTSASSFVASSPAANIST